MQAPPAVEHLVYNIQKSDKMEALRTLLDERDGAPAIVFAKTKHGVKRLARQLDSLEYPVGAIQGNLSQNARERVMADFRSGAAPILVATNVAARGLDFESVDQVINYDLPDSERLFTHRVGRTGRMGRSGEAVTFITAEDEPKWREIERRARPPVHQEALAFNPRGNVTSPATLLTPLACSSPPTEGAIGPVP